MNEKPRGQTTRRRQSIHSADRLQAGKEVGEPSPRASAKARMVRAFYSYELDKWSLRLLRLAIIAAPLACALGIFLMTASTDETWILLGARGLARAGQYGAGSPFRCDFSTAGLHSVMATLLDLASGGRLEAIRLVSPLSLAGIVFVLYRLAERTLGRGGAPCWIAVATILATRGTFMLGAQAYGEIFATLLVVTGAYLWDALPQGSWSRRLAVSAALGAAAAVRLNCIVALGALFLAAALPGSRRRQELVDALLASLVGVLLFLVQWEVQVLVSVPIDAVAEEGARGAYGLLNPFGSPLAYLVPERLGFWRVGEDYLPFLVIVLVLTAWFWVRRLVNHARGVDLLLTFGVVLWISWLLKAPIAHLRYVWPALLSFSCGAGMLLGALYLKGIESGRRAYWITALAVCGACVTSGYVEGARTYLHGDGDLQSWEWHRGTRQSLQYGPFKLAQGQRQMTARLREISGDEQIATLGFDTALGYVLDRPIVPISYFYPGKHAGLYRRDADVRISRTPGWVVITPFINRFHASHLSAALHGWMESNCRFEGKFGPYVLYRIVGPLPERPDIFSLYSWEAPLPLVPGPPPRQSISDE